MDDKDDDFAPKQRKKSFSLFGRRKKAKSDADLFSDESTTPEDTPTKERAQSDANFSSASDDVSLPSKKKKKRRFSFFKRKKAPSDADLFLSDSEPEGEPLSPLKPRDRTPSMDGGSVASSRRKKKGFVSKLFGSKSKRKLNFDDDDSDVEEEKNELKEENKVPVQDKNKYTDEEMQQVEKTLVPPDAEEVKRQEVKKKTDEMKRKQEELEQKEKQKKLDTERRRQEIKEREEALKRKEEEMKNKQKEEAEMRKKREEEIKVLKQREEERKKNKSSPRDSKKKKKSKLAAFLDKDGPEESESAPPVNTRKAKQYIQDLPAFEEEDEALTEDAIFNATEDDLNNPMAFGDGTILKTKRRTKGRRKSKKKHRDRPSVEKDARYSLLPDPNTEKKVKPQPETIVEKTSSSKPERVSDNERDALKEDLLRRKEELTVETDEAREEEERRAQEELEQLKREIYELEQEEELKKQAKRSLMAPLKRNKSKRLSKGKSRQFKRLNIRPRRSATSQDPFLRLITDALNAYAHPYFLSSWGTLILLIIALLATQTIRFYVYEIGKEFFKTSAMQTGYIGLLGTVMLMTDSEPVTLIVLSAMTLVSGAVAKVLEQQGSDGNPDDSGVIVSTAVSCGMVSYLLFRGMFNPTSVNQTISMTLMGLCYASLVLPVAPLIDPKKNACLGGMLSGFVASVVASKDPYDAAEVFYSSLLMLD